MIIKRIAIFYTRIEKEDSSDCGGVSTPGHGQGEGPDGDKWSKTTQETLGGAGVSEANGVLRNHYYSPGVTIYIEKRLTNHFLVSLIFDSQRGSVIGYHQEIPADSD